MAKSSDRGGGPGTYETNGVKCTLDAPWKNGTSKGAQENMSGTFNAPRSGGDNGLPTFVYDSCGGPKAAPGASSRDSLGTVLTNPKGPRR